MEESLTISKEAPDQKSMDYELLREEGLKYIQKIAGKVWTDYNTHDPGVTILEVLCYAITDLGYRTSYNIEDIIAPDPDRAEGDDIYNFFTAAEILPNAPVTVSDYRKLMIDVEVRDSGSHGCEYAGVKNAWIEKTLRPEVEIFVDKKESELAYTPVQPEDEPLDLNIMHNVLLEFDECERFGDLNENKIVRDLTIADHTPEPDLEGLVIRVDVEFPRWDDQMVDWQDDLSVARSIRGIELSFLNLGGNFSIEYELTPGNEVILTGTHTSSTGPVEIDGLEEITLKLNRFIFDPAGGMITFYRKKIAKIKEIVDRVQDRLHNNRNLCEDFMQFNALRVEEILVCADIELELDAGVEEAQARMYHEISRFLSPTVYFYSLDEMTTRCFDEFEYKVVAINAEERVFTIGSLPETLPEQDTVISISGSNNNDGTYTVYGARRNRDDESQADIFVRESISSEILTEGEQLYFTNIEKNQCTPTEKIFEGPLLNHGFIDDEELSLADRKKVIHVSDLIQIIMDVPGVKAVKDIQIANMPQGDEEGIIESRSVKWCLELAFDHNYVPRLNTDDSRITFFKDQLPFRANQLESDRIMEVLGQEERPQKLRNPTLDIDPPEGEYRNIEDFHSIQHEFPLVYGIGEEGVPTRTSDDIASTLPTETHARQLKGFLMHFDQMLANYLSQLAHVRDLFSMNPQKDEFGNFEIGRTYYTQPLFDIVPDADELYLDRDGHAADLDRIAESEEQFGERRNRFLDHLMARFAEQFTDYALLTHRISGSKAYDELIEDKLAFLNSYPMLSSRRGTAMNYRDPSRIWHKDNVSGLEDRAALLTGIEEQKLSDLNFSPRFRITKNESVIAFVIENDSSEEVLKSPGSFETIDEAKGALEDVVVNGVQKHKFDVKTDNGTDYYFQLTCSGAVIAESVKTDFHSDEEDGDVDQAIDEAVELLSEEFYHNPESNRHNLACPLQNYFDFSISVDMEPNPPTYTIEYQLYETPFAFAGADPVLTGSYTGEGNFKKKVRVHDINIEDSIFTVEDNIRQNLFEDDVVIMEGSGSSDGVYTVNTTEIDADQTIVTVKEEIPSDAEPLGNLLYSLVSEEEMQSLAESAVHDVLWNVVAHGVRRSSYFYDPATPPFNSPYRFRIQDIRGNLVGTSTETDFNEVLAGEIENINSSSVTVIGPGGGSNKEYGVVSAKAEGPNIVVEVDTTPSPAPSPDWQLQISAAFSLKDIKQSARIFIVGTHLSGRLSKGDTIAVTGSASNDGTYTILGITTDGSDSRIQVKEPIPSKEVEGTLEYAKNFPVIKSAGSIITVKGGGDEKAVNQMIELFQSRFFANEGMHLIEHILLRPKNNGPLFVDADEETLAEGLSDAGDLRFVKQYPLASANHAARMFRIEGDITNDLSSGMTISIRDAPLINGDFTVDAFSFEDPNTEITVEEILMGDIELASAEGTLSYSRKEPISAVDAGSRQITIHGSVADEVVPRSVLEITGSSGGRNDGLYMVETATAVDGVDETAFTIGKAEELVQDRLLSVNLDEDCECTLDNPYTCTAHVVLPYWPGRFTNNDFRKFFEKTLRREAPAHVFLNICWVSCRHMAAFERAYKAWLIENSRPVIDHVTLSTTLHQLIDSIEQLRNVYPEGTLHDCDDGESLENSIILNNSVLGEI